VQIHLPTILNYAEEPDDFYQDARDTMEEIMLFQLTAKQSNSNVSEVHPPPFAS